MKGDVYDDGTPNPLVVKCPYCGGEEIVEYIGTGSAKYRCKVCGKEFSYTCITGEQHVAESPKYGWVCPKCGKVYAPDVKECYNCNYLANINASGRTNQNPSTETRPQDVTVTMNAQEKRVREDGSLVIDKSWFPNLTKDSTVYVGGGGTNWRKAMECEHCNQEGEEELE